MYYPPVNVKEKQKTVKVDPENDDAHPVKNRPFTLPPGLYRPKQSLGQNFLSDQNYVLKIVNAFSDISEKGRRVIEIGPGPGALTRELFKRYPDMTAVEIDERGIKFLNEKLPGLRMIHMDILKFDWAQAAAERGGPINIIANLPYSIVSQVLFGLADAHKAINKAVVTMQLEVGQRITAKPGHKDYGIPSVIFQLYGQTSINFHIPPTVFYPAPKVDSALLTIDFTKPHKDLHTVDGDKLRRCVW
jgi:ribosomal RNA small subunit methyltransferase A